MKHRTCFRLSSAVFLVLILLLSLNVILVFTQSTTIVVPDDFATIQQAVNFAKSGDTIFVKAGTYSESIVIDKNRLTLTGENKQSTIIDGNGGTNQSLRVNNADFVKISGFTIQNTYDGICFYESSFGSVSDCIITTCSFRGIILILSSFNSISENALHDNHDGVELYKSSFNTVSANTITNSRFGIGTSRSFNDTFSENTIINSQSSIYIYDCSYDTISANALTNNAEHGISLVVSSYCSFSGNTITNNALHGISLSNCSYCSVSDNTIISSAQTGAHAYNSFQISYTKNTLINNNNGLGVYGSSHCKFTENTIRNSGGRGISIGSSSLCIVSKNTAIASANQGIQMFSSSDVTVTNNTLLSNQIGVGLYQTTQTNVYKNTITDGKVGFSVSLSDNNIFYHNSIADNQYSVASTNSSNIWDDGPVSGGNYWSDYTGTDFNGDGIGDTPYFIDVSNQDNYPLMSPEGTNQSRIYFNLLVDSLPSGVSFTLNGTSYVTPLSDAFTNATTINLEMPESYSYSDKNYTWNKWSDENPNRIRTIVITEDTNLTAVYELQNVPMDVSVVSPKNITYTTDEVPLQFNTNQNFTASSYSLDNQENITISGNTTLTELTNGLHTITLFVEDEQANITASETVHFTVEVEYVGFEILSPENKTYALSDVPLIYTKNETCNFVYFMLDDTQNYTDPGNTTLVEFADGPHELIAYVNYTNSEVEEKLTVYFTVNTTVPDSPLQISVISPSNTTYTTEDVPLNVTVDELNTWLAYSIDGQENITISGNTTLTSLTDGSHALLVYANDTKGNTGTSEVVFFTVELPPVIRGVTILSPENITYAVSEIPLDYLVNETCNSIVYSLDSDPAVNAENVTSLSDVDDGWHELSLIANFTGIDISEYATVWFAVDTISPHITDVIQVPINVTGTYENGAKINATVIDLVSGVKSVALNYTDGNGTWFVSNMTPLEVDIWNGTLPEFAHGTNVTYVIIAEDYAGNTITTEDLYGQATQYQVLLEFGSWLVLPMFVSAALGVTLYKKKLAKTAAPSL